MRKSIILLLIFISFSTIGQNLGLEFKAKYEDAKLALKKENYPKANSQFENLTKGYPRSNYSPYIQYFLGLSKFKLLQYNEAEKTLQSLLLNYPTWSQKDDVNFLLGNIYAEKNDLSKSLEEFNKVQNKNLSPKINSLIESQISKVKDKNILKNYAIQYPKFEVLKASAQNSKTKEIYGFLPENAPTLADNSKYQNQNKGYLNVAVLFPFHLKNKDFENNKNDNHFAIDMYDGMVFAAEKLKEEGIIVKLHAYDIDNQIEKMEKLLYNKQFLEEDLIIGPLYSETNKIAQYYANEKKIPLLNPLSKSNDLIDKKPYSYLVNASSETQAIQAADYASGNFFGDAIIIYGNNSKDSTIAKAYSIEFKKKTGKNAYLINYSANSLPNIDKNKVGHIFITSPSKMGSSIISLIQKKGFEMPILAMRDSFPEQLPYNFVNNLELYFINPDFVDENNEAIKSFKLDFWNAKSGLSSYYTFKGYDMINFWGKSISKYKVNFRNMITMKPNNNDFLLNGFDYSKNTNENNAIIITTFENGREVMFKKY